MNYGPTHQPRYNPTLPNYAALAALQPRVGQLAPPAPAPTPAAPAQPMTTTQKIMATLDKPNETVLNIPNKYLLGGAVLLGLIYAGHKAGTFDKLVGGKKGKK